MHPRCACFKFVQIRMLQLIGTTSATIIMINDHATHLENFLILPVIN